MRSVPYSIRAAACRTKSASALSQAEADCWLRLARRWDQSAISLAVAEAMERQGRARSSREARASNERRRAKLGTDGDMIKQIEPERAVEAAGRAGTWKWRVEEDVLTGDRRLAEIFGVGFRDIEKGVQVDALLSRVHPEDRPLLEANLARSVETDGEYEATYRLVLDDETRWIHANGKCFATSDGVGKTHVGVVIDISAFRTDPAEEDRRLILDRIAHHCLAAYQLSCDGEFDAVCQSTRDLLRMVGREIALSMADSEPSGRKP